MASGGAWLRGVQMFADGGAFTNSIVSKPTAFSYAGGLGVMGEAGPEAIMPLTRDAAAGRLGVRTAGNAGAAPSVDVQVNVINQSSQPLQAQQQGQPRIDQFGKVIIDMIVTDVRRGGPVSSTMEAAYGLRAAAADKESYAHHRPTRLRDDRHGGLQREGRLRRAALANGWRHSEAARAVVAADRDSQHDAADRRRGQP
ncbi:hypothetical protein JOS77_28310 [Chromobacterium haemolyticum]|nr:hypothetical protein JOS77_28310 [Chromobacterium haemolyticum]